MSFQGSPVHARLFAGFFDQPEISDVQKPEWPNLFYFVPENKILSFAQMNSQRADPHGSFGYFLYQPGIEQPAQKERHEPKQMLPT